MLVVILMSGDRNDPNRVRTLLNHAIWHNEPHIIGWGALVFRGSPEYEKDQNSSRRWDGYGG